MSSCNVAGRLALEFSGFPINVTLYSRVRKQRNESFRQIAPSGQPMKQGKPVDSATGESYEDKLTRKGYEVSKGHYVILPPEALEQISSGTKTRVAKPAQLVPVDSIAWDLAIDRYAVRPDDKVPGSEQSVNILWNGLRATQKAYVSQVSLTGGHDAILAVYASDEGLWAALLPFEDELYEVPTHLFEADAKAEALFAQVVEQQYGDKVGGFDHSAFKSEYRARRMDAIQKVIEGHDVVVDTKEPEAPAVPDLMAMLQASVASKTNQPEKETVNA